MLFDSIFSIHVQISGKKQSSESDKKICLMVHYWFEILNRRIIKQQLKNNGRSKKRLTKNIYRRYREISGYGADKEQFHRRFREISGYWYGADQKQFYRRYREINGYRYGAGKNSVTDTEARER